MVINLLVVSAESVAPIPEIKPNVSVKLEALKDVPSTDIVLNILAVFDMAVPEIPIPPPPVKVTFPVAPPKDKTPVLLMVGVCPEDTVKPVPAVRE